MIIRKEPRNPKDYIIVDSDTHVILHTNGFLPRFMSLDAKKYFYTKNKNIINFMNEHNLIALEEK